MSATPPRCRFAPSPTGYLHVGSAQSALFNWLFARGHGGVFCLRVEDTDTERNRPELTDNILEMLRWLGIDWDEGPVRQSERLALYAAAADRLHREGVAYWCDCTREDVDRRAAEAGRPPGYDGFCRDRGLEPGADRALRFRTPDTGVTRWADAVRGDVSFENATIQDFVIVRSDGSPLFLIANAVDDADMRISHVIRGEDHVSNTARYLLLWEALGSGPPPAFAHLPLLVNEQRKKLSKRRDAVSVADFKAEGYLGPAMRNYLALLGWGPRDEIEIRPIEEIAAMFELEDVSPSAAFFDVQKLRHVNGEYLRALPVAEFIALASDFLPEGDEPRRALELLAPLVQERVRTLAEVPGMLSFLWEQVPEVDERAWAKAFKDERAATMLDAAARLLAEAAWDAEHVEEAVRAAGAEAGFLNPEGHVQVSKAQAPVRVAVTGKGVGLPLWESLVALGRERALERLRVAGARLAERTAS